MNQVFVSIVVFVPLLIDEKEIIINESNELGALKKKINSSTFPIELIQKVIYLLL